MLLRVKYWKFKLCNIWLRHLGTSGVADLFVGACFSSRWTATRLSVNTLDVFWLNLDASAGDLIQVPQGLDPWTVGSQRLKAKEPGSMSEGRGSYLMPAEVFYRG